MTNDTCGGPTGIIFSQNFTCKIFIYDFENTFDNTKPCFLSSSTTNDCRHCSLSISHAALSLQEPNSCETSERGLTWSRRSDNISIKWSDIHINLTRSVAKQEQVIRHTLTRSIAPKKVSWTPKRWGGNPKSDPLKGYHQV